MDAIVTWIIVITLDYSLYKSDNNIKPQNETHQKIQYSAYNIILTLLKNYRNIVLPE